MHHKGKGKVRRNNPYLIFHQSVDRKAQSAIREGNYKLVKTWRTQQLELFDLSKDIGEENNLAEEMPEKVKDLDEKLTNFLSVVKAETKKTEK